MSRRRFSNGNTEEVLNKCPLCGSELEYHDLIQFSDVYRILKNGKVSRTKRLE